MREVANPTSQSSFNSLDVQMWPTKTAEPQRAPTNLEMFRQLDADLYLAHQLFRRGRSSQVLAGVTGFNQCKERIRVEIDAAHFADEFTYGERNALSTETFSQAFERLYGEPLHKPKVKGK